MEREGQVPTILLQKLNKCHDIMCISHSPHRCLHVHARTHTYTVEICNDCIVEYYFVRPLGNLLIARIFFSMVHENEVSFNMDRYSAIARKKAF